MFLAALVEADVVPVLTGVVAHLGYVDPGFAILAASAGAFTGDCVWFLAGRCYSKRIQATGLYRRLGLTAENLIQKLGIWGIPASHMIYGTRVATMIVWGVQRFSTVKFALVDAFGCVGFTTLLFMLGFGFSASASHIIEGVKRVELLMLGALTVTVLFFHLISRAARRRVEQLPTGDGRAKGR